MPPRRREIKVFLLAAEDTPPPLDLTVRGGCDKISPGLQLFSPRQTARFPSKGQTMTEKMILLVEDNPDDEMLTLRALERNNIDNRVVVARDGAEALNILFGQTETGLHPSLVLLDLRLPKLDGLEVLSRLRSEARTRLVPIVIFTSSDEEQDIQRSYALGANSYIRKPIDFSQYSEAIRQTATYWLKLNISPPPASA
jgi:two-component system response regulator